MACELFTREFSKKGGEVILVTTRQLSASKALELHVDLIGVLGNAVFPFIDNKYNFSDVINIMRGNDGATVMKLIKECISHVNIDGKEIRPALFDIHFDGELMLVMQLFGFVLEANFLDFFKQGLEINERRRLEAEEASKLAAQKLKAEQTSQSNSQK